MSVTWTFDDEPVPPATFGGRVATFGGPALTAYGNLDDLTGPYSDICQFNTNSSNMNANTASDFFTLDGPTNFTAITAVMKMNSGSAGTCVLLLLDANGSGVVTFLRAITVSTVVPSSSVPIQVTADVSGTSAFQNVPAGTYQLAAQANGQSIRLGSTTDPDFGPFNQTGAGITVIGDPYESQGGGRGSPPIWIEGSPVGTEVIRRGVGKGIGRGITRGINR